ncbi:hypothetical protein G7072_03590 [Nocardioides sp. HDW12B]|uniref:hypothetical protein n=1 Tax=Nocardioides sp. HDW12B TaxID=2714939 RepID=UPI00140AA05B|nr:hypothetical protein [Nocardioides sp. HDW12B]QIK65542.1 hypothetical protein G7072_03590 [Nocardioides sp. HDW12B]
MRWPTRTRAVVTAAVVLLLVAGALTVTTVRYGDGVSRPLALLWTYALIGAGFAGWSVHRQRLAADPHFYERRRLNEPAERVQRRGGLAVTLLVLLVMPRDLTRAEQWGITVGAAFLAYLPVHLLTKRRDARARLWGRPRPLSDQELAQRRD